MNLCGGAHPLPTLRYWKAHAELFSLLQCIHSSTHPSLLTDSMGRVDGWLDGWRASGRLRNGRHGESVR